MHNDHYVISNVNYKNAEDIPGIIELLDCENNSKWKKNYEPIVDKTMNKDLLDLYLPNHIKENSPMILFTPGGGWRRGDKIGENHCLSNYDTNFLMYCVSRYYQIYRNVGHTFAAAGIPCAVVNYPLIKIEFPYRFLEIFMSALNNVIFFSLVAFVALAFITIANFAFNTTLSLPSIWLYVLLTQIFTIATIVRRRQFYDLSNKLTASIVLFGIFAEILIYSSLEIGESLFIPCVFSLFWTQAVIYFCRYYRTPATGYQETKRGVAEAIAFCSNLVATSKTSSGSAAHLSSLYLVGHSAGSQLNTTIMMDHKYANDAGIVYSLVKGIVNSSSVYDLFELEDYKYSRYSYLYSCFGHDINTWTNESPMCSMTRLLDTPTAEPIPPLLNIDAEHDNLLIPQCKRFCELAGCGVRSRTVAGVSHFGIIWNFHPASDFLRYVLEFINSVENKI